MTTEAIVLFQLDVIHVGLAIRGLQVRLPSGEMAYLQIPEGESHKFRSALEAVAEEGSKKDAETRFERILKD